jgi:hypothetical protein
MGYGTAREVTVRYLENIGAGIDVTIPKGMLLLKVNGKYAVQSTALLIKLTGNTHDPKYRWCYVPADAVEVVA